MMSEPGVQRPESRSQRPETNDQRPRINTAPRRGAHAPPTDGCPSPSSPRHPSAMAPSSALRRRTASLSPSQTGSTPRGTSGSSWPRPSRDVTGAGLRVPSRIVPPRQAPLPHCGLTPPTDGCPSPSPPRHRSAMAPSAAACETESEILSKPRSGARKTCGKGVALPPEWAHVGPISKHVQRPPTVDGRNIASELIDPTRVRRDAAARGLPPHPLLQCCRSHASVHGVSSTCNINSIRVGVPMIEKPDPDRTGARQPTLK